MASINSNSNRSFSRPNNQAARFFAKGKFRESLASLQVALLEAKSITAQKSPPNGAQHHHHQQQQQQQPSQHEEEERSLRMQSVRLEPSHHSSVVDGGMENPCGVTFFDRMFVILNNGDAGSDSNDGVLLCQESTEHKVCALILYNMGVSYHLGALLTTGGGGGAAASGKHRKELFGQAFTFYHMATGVLHPLKPSTTDDDRGDGDDGMTNERDNHDDGDDVFLLLSMALMNNMAHILSTGFHFQETNHCLQWLRQAAEHLHPTQLHDDDVLFFFLRYYVMPSNDMVASPAA